MIFDVSGKLPNVIEQPVTGGTFVGLRLVSDWDCADALLDVWATWMLARGLAERTVQERVGFISRLSRATGEHPMQFTTDSLAGYLAGIKGSSTRCTYYGAMKAWASWLVQTGRRLDDPVAPLGTPRQPRRQPHPIETVHLEALLSSRMHRRTRAMILLGAYQGLRVHEIAKVRGEDIDIIGGKLRIQGKGGVVVWAPLHPAVARIADEWPGRGWWFPSYHDRREHVLGNSVSTVISKAMARCRIPGTAHSLRHWYATQLIRSGSDARTVQTLLRHATLAHIAIYTEIADEQRDAAILRLPWVGSASKESRS